MNAWKSETRGAEITTLFESATSSSYIDSTCRGNPDTLDGQSVYRIVDKKAEFPGGKDSLFRYLSQRIKYPRHNQHQGTIIITFVVDSSGKARAACIYKRFESDRLTSIEKELIRIVNTMPYWKPAEIKSNKVHYREVIPIKLEIPIYRD